MVRVEGFEPSVSCSQSRRIEPDFPTLGYYMVRGTGLEPVRTKREILSLLWLPLHHPRKHLVPQVGLEPTRTRHWLLRPAWLPLHHRGKLFGVKAGIEPCLTVSQTVVQPLHY